MRADAKHGEIDQLEDLRDRPGLFKQFRTFARKQPLGLAGGLVVLLFIVLAVLAPWLSPFDPEASSYAHMLAPPGTVSDEGTFILGTDDFGRDVLTRIIYGAQTALFVGFTCALIGATVGLVLGVGSAFFGGKIDLLFQRVMDVFMAFPLIIMALSIVAIFGSSIQNVIIAITIPFIPRCARVVRSSALAIREIPYIDAARANGFSNTRIILRHMVPNVMAPYLIMVTAFVGQAILLEASLSFLGLGVQEPTPAWGLMLKNAQEYIRSEPWIAIWPGLAITLGVFGFNLFGDALRDALDPRLRSAQ
ncbi:MAG: ABC transporter permease [Alphaproteobacteria bacterium]|nr:ABC transporter permease [Alphaproteobacteria bacterium]